jgi:DnaJ-class molecular chaperone
MPSSEKSHYAILGLSRSSQLSSVAIKNAYHQTLLTYHPDKANVKSYLTSQPSGVDRSPSVPSVDEIIAAYNTLSDPKLRSEYDSRQKVDALNNGRDKIGYSGVETFDLEDMNYEIDESSAMGMWSKPCRCGHEEAFRLTEEELERFEQASSPEGTKSRTGEILLACRGCSLHIRVMFAIQNG